MKTIEQRLQSRISRRRNFIRFMEEDMAGTKASRVAIRDIGLFPEVVVGLSAKIAESRTTLKGLADDQRLDKQLKNIMLRDDFRERHIANGYRFVRETGRL